MYAIFESGGKQHRAAPGEVVTLERLDGEAGAKVTFDKVLVLTTDQGTQVGAPHVAGVTVEATVLEQTRGRKIFVFKKKRRKKFRRRQGHRQSLTRVVIDAVGGHRAQAAPPKAKAAPRKAAPAKPADQPAAETKAPAKETAAKKASAKKAPAKKPADKTAPARKAPAKKPAAKKEG